MLGWCWAGEAATIMQGKREKGKGKKGKGKKEAGKGREKAGTKGKSKHEINAIAVDRCRPDESITTASTTEKDVISRPYPTIAFNASTSPRVTRPVTGTRAGVLFASPVATINHRFPHRPF